MVTPLACLFIVSLLPYFWTIFAVRARKEQLGAFDNKHPRLQQAELTGIGARAVGAHNNAFEALLLFAPAVILAMWAGVEQSWVARLSVVFVVCRVGHGVAYLTDQDKLRSSLFAIGLLSVVSLWLLILSAAA